MGLHPLAEAPRLIRDDQYDSQIALKATLFKQHGRAVFDCLPDTQDSFDEAAALLSVAKDFQSTCLNVQEDLLVLVPRDGAFVLAGGGLFFPSLWQLHDKIGKPLLDVHDPVPHYAEQIGGKVNRLLTRLPEAAPVMRFNWTLHDTPDLFHPVKGAGGNDLYLRSERQTLSKLPQTGAVLFTIKTELALLDDVIADEPAWARYLYDAISAMDAGMLAYKFVSAHYADRVLMRLKSAIGQAL